MASLTIIWQSLFDWGIPFALIVVFLRYRDPCIYYLAFYICLYHMRFFTPDCSRVRGLSTQDHIYLHRFQAFRLCLYSLHLDQAFKLRLCFLQISGVQTLPLLSSFQILGDFSFSIFDLDFGRLDFTFAFWMLGVQTSPFDVFTLDFKRSDFAFVVFILDKAFRLRLHRIFSISISNVQTLSSVDQVFRLPLLQSGV